MSCRKQDDQLEEPKEQEASQTESIETRNFTRVTFEEENSRVTLTFEDYEAISGKIISESFTGIGVHVVDPEHLSVDQVISVEYYGAPATGIVRRVEQDEDSQWTIGIQWKPRK